MSIVIPESELLLSYARSGGAGGQNVNKVSSKVVLHWDPSQSTVLNSEQLYRLRCSDFYRNRSNLEGYIVLSCDSERSQEMNRREVISRLQALVNQALKPRKKRIATKPSRGAKERRLQTKKIRGKQKKMRGSSAAWD